MYVETERRIDSTYVCRDRETARDREEGRYYICRDRDKRIRIGRKGEKKIKFDKKKRELDK